MKTITKMVALLGATALLAYCSDSINNPVIEETNTVNTEGLDPVIAEIRAHKYTPDTTIYLTREQMDTITENLLGANNQPTISSGQSVYNSNGYIFRQKNEAINIAASSSGLAVEAYKEASYNCVVVGIGATSTRETITHAGIWESQFSTDGTIMVGTGYQPVYKYGTNPKKVAHNTELHALAPTSGMLLNEGDPNLPPRVHVVVGIGIWMKTDNINGIWLYMAEYNQQTRQLEISTPNDIKVTEITFWNGTGRTDEPEVELRLADHITDLSQLRRTVITGFGASSKSNSVSRIGIKYSILPLFN